MNPTRREFLHAAATIGVAPTARSKAVIEPIRRNGKSHLRLSIAAYGFDRHLDLKKPTMTLDDFIDRAAEMGLDAVELTAYYFPKTTPEYLAHLKGRCTRLGLDVSGTAVGNNFCVSDAAKLRAEIANVKQWIEHSSRLGAKTMRIFAGTVDKGDTEEKARTRCIDAIHEVCDHAGKYGIILALENHGGITATIDQMLTLVRAIKHDWFGVNWDSGNFHSSDPYADLERLAPYAVTAHLKTQVQLTGKKKEEADLARMVGILRKAGFRGYVALEYEGEGEPKTAIPRHIEQLRKLMA
jgi:sugar phosphate isomerase/epimerase